MYVLKQVYVSFSGVLRPLDNNVGYRVTGRPVVYQSNVVL